MKLDIMGLQFDNVTMDEASARAEQILAGKKTCYAVTPNAEIAYEALYDETLRALINGADLVLPDGAGVVLASKLLKTPLKQKVAGVDFADRLLSILEKTGGGLFLLGSKPGVAELAAQKMTEKHQKLYICGMNDGYFKDEAPVIEKIKARCTLRLPRRAEAGAVYEKSSGRAAYQAYDRPRRFARQLRGHGQARSKVDDPLQS